MSKPCDRCGGVIKFVRLDTGKAIPVDPIPSKDRGNVAAAKNERGELVGHVMSASKPEQAHQSRYVPHYASCKPDRPLIPASQRPPSLFDP